MNEQTNKNQKIKEKDEGVAVKELSKSKQTKKPNDNLITWIILGVGLVIILTIIVLIGLKLQKSKNAAINDVSIQNEIVPQVTTEEPQIDKTLTKKELIKEAFYYPNTIKERADEDYDLVFYTNDSIETVYKYYEKLVNLNSWKLGPVGMATDKSGGFLNIYQNDFDSGIEVKKSSGGYGSTEINIRINDKEEISLTSTLNRPQIETNQAGSSLETKTSQTLKQNEDVLPFSNSRKIVKEDLTSLSEWQLKVARNEIYARHGRDFVHQDLSCYFNKLPWYKIDSEYSENKLSSLEISNAVFILNYEKEIESSLINYDTGCKE